MSAGQMTAEARGRCPYCGARRAGTMTPGRIVYACGFSLPDLPDHPRDDLRAGERATAIERAAWAVKRSFRAVGADRKGLVQWTVDAEAMKGLIIALGPEREGR